MGRGLVAGERSYRGNYLPHHRLWVLPLRTLPVIWVYYRIDEANRQVHPVDIQIFPF